MPHLSLQAQISGIHWKLILKRTTFSVGQLYPTNVVQVPVCADYQISTKNKYIWNPKRLFAAGIKE